ncbi:MAG: hypothetical protein R6T90_06360, partial [Dissulfuribacterales bacterium]
MPESKAMNAGMELLKPLIQEGDIDSKGKCVFATVKGDLHDIGKKLVSMYHGKGSKRRYDNSENDQNEYCF